MFGYEIENCLRSIKEFVGVFPRDKIPQLTSYPSLLIINTDESSKPGRHWVAMRFTEKDCEYFDSFGMPPLHYEMVRAVQKRKLVWNGRCVQHPKSRTCGEFCVAFVKARSQKIPYPRFIKNFSSNIKGNDNLVKSLCYEEKESIVKLP